MKLFSFLVFFFFPVFLELIFPTLLGWHCSFLMCFRKFLPCSYLEDSAHSAAGTSEPSQCYKVGLDVSDDILSNLMILLLLMCLLLPINTFK